MPGFPTCASCNELITEEDYFETRVNLRLRDASEVKGKVPTHVAHGVEEHLRAVGDFLRPYLSMSAGEDGGLPLVREKKSGGRVP